MHLKFVVKSIVSSLALCALFTAAAHAQGVKSLADYKAEAEAAVNSITVNESLLLQEDDAVVFVDIRDSAEVARTGKVKDAVHVPRGMLEFYIDPESSMHKKMFATDKTIVFYCATGGRSLLAAKLARDMGVKSPVFLEGGFRAWQKADAETSK